MDETQWMKQAYVDENEWMKVDETVKGGWKMWMKDETKWMKRSGWIRWERPSPVSAVRAGAQLQLQFMILLRLSAMVDARLWRMGTSGRKLEEKEHVRRHNLKNENNVKALGRTSKTELELEEDPRFPT